MFRLIGYQKELERIQKEFGYDEDEAEERTNILHKQIWHRIDVYLRAIGWTSSTLYFTGSGMSKSFDEWLELRRSVEHFNDLPVDEKENIYEFEENHGCVLKEIMPEEKQMNFIGFDDESDYEEGVDPQPDRYRISETVIFDGVDYTAHTRRGLRRIVTDYKLVIKMYIKK